MGVKHAAPVANDRQLKEQLLEELTFPLPTGADHIEMRVEGIKIECHRCEPKETMRTQHHPRRGMTSKQGAQRGQDVEQCVFLLSQFLPTL